MSTVLNRWHCFLATLAAMLLMPWPAAAERMCTKMGCADHVSVVLRTSDGQPATDVEIQLDIDGRTATCKPSPPGSQNGAFQCDSDVSALHEEIQRCRAGACHGVGKFEQTIEIAGRAKKIRVVLVREGKVLAQRMFTGGYAWVRPNGPRCPPACRQARHTWRYR